MSTPSGVLKNEVALSQIIENLVRIGVLAIVVFWCFQIVSPFIIPVAWGIIIAVAIYPVYLSVAQKLGNRTALTAVLFALIALAVIILPSVMLAGTVVDGTKAVTHGIDSGTLAVPSPPESVSDWPVIGKSVHRIWELASVNLGAALAPLAPHLKAFGSWLLSAGVGLGLGILQFVFAIIIAAVMLTRAASGGRAARAISVRLAGDRGIAFTAMAEATVRSVARGILGVALIQSLLAGLGFMVMGIPGAGIWALLCLILAVVQIGPMLVLIPIIIYAFSVSDPLPATIFMIWCILVGVLDNFLKPILLGRGVQVPMLVIFVGAIGGFIAYGIIGLFVGAIILTLGYELLQAWLVSPVDAVASGETESGTTPESG